MTGPVFNPIQAGLAGILAQQAGAAAKRETAKPKSLRRAGDAADKDDVIMGAEAVEKAQALRAASSGDENSREDRQAGDSNSRRKTPPAPRLDTAG
ncbi:MAG TPA: hypothetical protein VD971_09850 [Phycisphaerales bacterium]|nr:hypothetical protein [Phycisphaerales bacterium]